MVASLWIENTAFGALVPSRTETSSPGPNICYIGAGEAEFGMSEVQKDVKLTGIENKALRRTGLRIAAIVLAGLMLSACDKCGNSIFHAEAGPQMCRDQAPR